MIVFTMLRYFCLWILFNCSLQTISAIKTENCTQYQIEIKLRNSLKCLLDNINKMMESKYGDQFCYNLYQEFPCFNDKEKILSCVTDPNKKMLDASMKQFVDTIISPSLCPCASANLTVMQADEINLLKPENHTVSNKINEIVKFDKNMSFNSFKWDNLMYKNGTKINQMLKIFYMYGTYTLTKSEKCVKEKIFGLIVNLGFGFLDDWLLPCHIFVDITEECMEPNDYLSPRDTHFLRLMTITIYKGVMDLFLDKKHQEFVIKAYSNVSGYNRNRSKSDIENIRRDFHPVDENKQVLRV